MNIRLIFLTVSMALIFSTSLYAQDRRDEASPLRVLKVALDLTEDQVIELRDLIEARAEANRSIGEQLNVLQEQLEAAIGSEVPDALEIGELMLDIRSLREELAQNQGDIQMGFREMLTPEQLERVGHIHQIDLATRAAEVLGHLKLR